MHNVLVDEIKLQVQKDETKSEHLLNVVYHALCPKKKGKFSYVRETRRRLGKRIAKHRQKEKNSHVKIHMS